MSIHSTGFSHDEITPAPKTRGSRGPPGITIKYAPLSDWFVISGMRRTATYEALGRGDLRAVKLNNRTLIDVERGLAWLASLPAAEITTGRRRDAANAASGCEAAS
jgi:hypothetical protein